MLFSLSLLSPQYNRFSQQYGTRYCSSSISFVNANRFDLNIVAATERWNTNQGYIFTFIFFCLSHHHQKRMTWFLCSNMREWWHKKNETTNKHKELLWIHDKSIVRLNNIYFFDIRFNVDWILSLLTDCLSVSSHSLITHLFLLENFL